MCPEEDYSLKLMLAIINFVGILIVEFRLELEKLCNYMTHSSCLTDCDLTVHHYVFCQSIVLRQHESEHAYTVCHSSSVEPDNVQLITSLSAREEPCK